MEQFKGLMLNEKEQNLLKKMKKGNEDIQYLSSYDGEFLVTFGNNVLRTRTVLTFYLREGFKLCLGHIGEKSFSIDSSKEKYRNNIFSVFIDRRLEECVNFHIKTAEYQTVQSTNQDNQSEQVLLTFIEDNLNAQLIIFDGQQNKKLAEMIVSSEESKDKLRFFAMSYVSQHFPGLFKNGGELYDQNYSKLPHE